MWGVWSDRAGAGHGRGTEACRESHGSVTDVSRRHADAGNVTLPPAFPRPGPGEFAVLAAMRIKVRTHSSRDLSSAQDDHGSPTFVTSLCRVFHEPLTSWASH